MSSLKLNIDVHSILATECIFEENPQVLGRKSFDYMVSKTFYRPREVIQFLKLCHEDALNYEKKVFDSDSIERAEETFSKWKFDHLCSEYINIYPKLEQLLLKFKRLSKNLSRNELEKIIINEILKDDSSAHYGEWLEKAEPEEIIQILYKVGFIGAKKEKIQKGEQSDFYYFFNSSEAHFDDTEMFEIHPSFWSYLNL